MGNYQAETVAQYTINGQEYYVTLYWQGKEPTNDPDSFYDVFDEYGICLNEGYPWHDDGQGIPTQDDVAVLVADQADLLTT
jgi:hypothetical protein